MSVIQFPGMRERQIRQERAPGTMGGAPNGADIRPGDNGLDADTTDERRREGGGLRIRRGEASPAALTTRPEGESR